MWCIKISKCFAATCLDPSMLAQLVSWAFSDLSMTAANAHALFIHSKARFLHVGFENETSFSALPHSFHTWGIGLPQPFLFEFIYYRNLVWCTLEQDGHPFYVSRWAKLYYGPRIARTPWRTLLVQHGSEFSCNGYCWISDNLSKCLGSLARAPMCLFHLLESTYALLWQLLGSNDVAKSDEPCKRFGPLSATRG